VHKFDLNQIHSTQLNLRIKIALLKELKNTDFTIEYVSFKKKDMNQDYYLIAVNNLIEKLKNKNIDQVFLAIKDNRKSINNKIIQKAQENNLKISITNTISEKGLQIADFVSWSIFQKYEKEDSDIYELLKK
jgi:GTPase